MVKSIPMRNPKSQFDFATVVAISIVAWAISNTGHEIIGHGGVCALQGHSTVYVSTSFHVCENAGHYAEVERISAVGGTAFNLLLAGICLILLTRAKISSGPTRYFLWLVLTLNLFYSGSYIMGWFIGPTLDWSLFLIGLEPPWLWRVGLEFTGVLILWVGFTLSRRLFEPLLGNHVGERKRRMTVLTLTPYLTAIVIKVSAAAVSPNEDKMLVLLGAFGATGFFLGWIHFLRFWPLPKKDAARESALEIGRSIPWIVGAAITLGLYVGVLGRGIGKIP